MTKASKTVSSSSPLKATTLITSYKYETDPSFPNFAFDFVKAGRTDEIVRLILSVRHLTIKVAPPLAYPSNTFSS